MPNYKSSAVLIRSNECVIELRISNIVRVAQEYFHTNIKLSGCLRIIIKDGVENVHCTIEKNIFKYNLGRKKLDKNNAQQKKLILNVSFQLVHAIIDSAQEVRAEDLSSFDQVFRSGEFPHIYTFFFKINQACYEYDIK